VPAHRMDGALRVYHPRWIYPPLFGSLNGVFLFLRLLWPAARLRRRFRYQVIDAHFGHPDGVAAALLSLALRVPFAVTLRGNETMHAGFAVRRFLLRWTLRRAGRVITVSEALRQFALSMGAEAAKTVTIPNGIDTHRFYPRDILECRLRLGMPADRKIILSAGYLIERKGHHHAIRALKALRGRGIDVCLWIAGGAGREGAFEDHLRRLTAELKLEPWVHFTGAVPHETLSELMAAADVLCLASFREGWPNVVHEALGCGTPVVSTDVGGVPDLLPGPDYGYIVPAGDLNALEDALYRALARSWDRGAIAAWGRSRSWSQAGAEAVAQLRQCAAPAQ